jgi:hypothetical protein
MVRNRAFEVKSLKINQFSVVCATLPIPLTTSRRRAGVPALTLACSSHAAPAPHPIE